MRNQSGTCARLVSAETPNPVIADVVEAHILPRFQSLADTSAQLATAAQSDCNPASPALRAAYGAAFDAWIAASHLRFGPTEIADRAYALAFWPDSRSATPRTLASLIATLDPVATSPESYAQVSIAARGFYAMELLIYDDTLIENADAAYTCMMMQTMAADIAATSVDILTDWQPDYAEKLRAPTDAGPYRSDAEVLQELLKTLSTGLEFTSEVRLGRPLGTFERPRPTRAESWHAGRSTRHVALSLTSLRDLGQRLSQSDPALQSQIDMGFASALAQLATLDDPVFAGVATLQGRLKIEIIKQSVDAVRAVTRDRLGPALGVAAGFNALDGD